MVKGTQSPWSTLESEDAIMKLEKGMRVWVPFGKERIAGVVLDFTDSRQCRDYEQVKVQLLKVNPLSPGQLLRQVYPRPIQSYKLTKRFDSEILPGEVQA